MIRVSFNSQKCKKATGDVVEKKKLYIMTYEHGGYVLWGDHLKPRLKNILRWMEEYPKLKIGLDYESFTFDEYTKVDPEIIDLIKELLEKYPDRVGLGATTYGQPLSLTISEESNARQLTYSVRTNMEHFGLTPSVYSISEFALNNQTPQLAKLVGYEAAVLRSHVMGFGYPRTFDSAWGRWIGRDKTEIPALPTYDGEGRGFNCCTVDNWILSRWPNDSQLYSLEDFEEMFKKYEPLIATRYDDVCQDIEPITKYTQTKDNYEYILLEDIPKLCGKAEDELATTDNDFHVQMPWGYCGNEIFNGVRAAEVGAVQAEKLNALAVMLGGKAQNDLLDEAWKKVLVAQHHDITICGLLDLSRRFIPESLKASDEVSADSLKMIAARFADSQKASTVGVNLHSFTVDEWVETENGNVHVQLPAFTAKRIEKDTNKYSFAWNDENSELVTPNYKVKLTEDGIAFIDEIKTGRRIFDNGEGALFTALVENESCASKGVWSVEISEQGAVAVQDGKIGGIPYRFEMHFNGDSARIDCKARFDMHGEHVGESGNSYGLNKSVTVDGMINEHKLNFNMNICLDKSRRMVRDIPYSISDWSGDVRDLEDYWYKTDRIIYDKAVSHEESFNSSTYLNGIYWVSLRDENNGLAVMNRGCMGSVVRGNLLSIPLLYSNLYMCGTRILNGVFDDEFAIFPFDSSVSDADVHRNAMSYAYQPSVAQVEAGNGDLSEFEAASFKNLDGEIVLTTVYPENGALLARFCNYSDKNGKAKFSSAIGKVEEETDLLGNKIADVTGDELDFRPWEVKTVRIKM